jgi:DUF971 family protein
VTPAIPDHSSTGVSAQPLTLRLNGANRWLEIEWVGGKKATLRCEYIREGCRCAECLAILRRGDTISIPRDLSLTEILPFGPGAVRLTFSDGHSRGIFPFQYLWELSDREAISAVS